MTPIDPPQALIEHLRAADRFLLCGHMNPDGDSIGSALGLSRLLSQLGKSCTVWNRDETPAIYLALPGADRLRVGLEPPVSPITEHFDAIVMLECPSLARSGLQDSLTGLPVLNMDHHLGNENYGDVNWVDAASPALGEMILRLSRAMGLPLGARAATALLVALSSDTGGFRFANATARAFEAGARLVDAGADPTEVSKWLHESQPEPSIRLLGEMLTSLELTENGKIASVLLTAQMFSNSGATPAHSEGLINHPRSIAGVEAVALVRELEPGSCKVSLRSRGSFDVERIARSHSGGGHRNAAGFSATGESDAIRQLAVTELAQEVLRDEV
jgi:phosphoesterase RecJ-like protein